MSETKKSPNPETPKLTLSELKFQYNKLLRVRESLPGNMEQALNQFDADYGVQVQELNSAKARLIEEPMEARDDAIAAAKRSFHEKGAKLLASFEEETKPARDRYNALVAEAAKDRDSQIQSAKTGFNEAAEVLHKELKQDLENLALQRPRKEIEIRKAHEEQMRKMDANLAAMKEEIDCLEAKRSKKAEPAKEAAANVSPAEPV